MTGPSQHLSWSELRCHDAIGTVYPLDWRETRLPVLAEAFEAVRTQCGNRPIPVLSGYRTPAHNAAVGGAPASQHVQGRALDLRPPTGMPLRQFYDAIRELMPRTAIRGLGLYPTFVHLDVRPGERLCFFAGARAAADTRRT